MQGRRYVLSSWGWGWGVGGFIETRKGGENIWASTPPSRVSTSPVTSPFAAVLLQFCSRALFHAHSLKSANSALSALYKSFGSIKMSQMSEVKGQSEQTAQAPQSAERNLGLRQKVLYCNHKTTLHDDRSACDLFTTTKCFCLTSRLLLFQCI